MIWVSIFLLACTVAFANARQLLFLPNTYVVEFQKRHQDDLFQHLAQHKIEYHLRHRYDMMNAISLSFNTSNDATRFFNLMRQDIHRTWPVNAVARPNAKLLHVGKKPATGLFNYYNDTGVTQLRQELGLTGREIKVGIIDSGIDYTHPSLGGCFGKQCRVAFGHDFVGDDYTGDNQPIPDDDPMDCNGHGTHVAGIIGAEDKEYKFTGVAPEVTLGAYRIFGCSGGSADDVIMKAMEQAYYDGMDVVNLSLGDLGWPDSPASVLADVLTLKGMMVVAAAGNEGDKGMFQVGAPSLGRHALSVASTDNSVTLAHPIQYNGLSLVRTGYSTSSGKPFKVTEGEIVPVSDMFMAPNDACEPVHSNHLLGKIALIARGGCYFSEKAQNVQAAGAIAAIFYNNNPGLVNPSVNDPAIRIQCGGISNEQGQALFNMTTSNPGIQFKLPNEDVQFEIPTAGTISSYSSWGLGPDLGVKPDIAAPGGEIYSTYLTKEGGYATLSGTSMASPHVAGIIALLQQAKGGGRSLHPEELRATLVNTGDPLIRYQSTTLESVARQGSGLINVYKSIHASTRVTPEQIALRDLSRHTSDNEYTFTIHNNGRMAGDYKITHIPATTVQGYSIGDDMAPLQQPIQLEEVGTQAIVESIYPTELNIPANEAANVTVRLHAPVTEAPSVYSGYFKIAKENDEDNTLFLPYAGLSTELASLPVLYVNRSMPMVMLDTAGVSNRSPALVQLQLIHPSPLLLVTAVDAKNTSESFGIIPGGYWAFLGRNNVHDINDSILMVWGGDVATSPEQAMAEQSTAAAAGLAVMQPKLFRSSKNNGNLHMETAAAQNFSNDSKQLPSGLYKLKVMALHAFGDYENDADYDIWYSDDIYIRN
ncbi:subtilisin-like protein [Lichtheimia hyalospora FSU 10163]|nr:subtilisin-like protein [Lichtheimia hyalospora FSU 10163]